MRAARRLCNSSKEPGDTASSTSACAWGDMLHMPFPVVHLAPGGLASPMENQALEELEASSSKKKNAKCVLGQGREKA